MIANEGGALFVERLITLVRRQGVADPWLRVDPEAYDALQARLPDLILPRNLPTDPSVFVQLGPLPHARIEASLCLAALMHRTAQVVQQQIEEGVGNLEEEPEGAADPVAPSPFESQIPPQMPQPKNWRHKKRRWK